ncbi:hypothetical protein [Microbacterium sp. KR10-403]|uniref:hypothetical protein n=1 Tax=Microbacterium sp. KR10-403 TaxID=3158581 RepID=UPI0032E3E398
MTQSNTKKKALAVGLAGTLVAGGLVLGGTFANLGQTITDQNTHTVKVDSFNFAYSESSGTLNADLTPGADASHTKLEVNNLGALPATFAFTITDLTGSDLLAHPVAKDTQVTIEVKNMAAQQILKWSGTLGDLLTHSIVSSQPITPYDLLTVDITMETPVDVDPAEWEPFMATAVNTSFKTAFTFSAYQDGTSPLLAFAQANTVAGETAFAGESENGDNWDYTTYLIPNADVATAAGL